MPLGTTDWIDTLIERQQLGRSLDRAFYVAPAVFERDRERVFANHWIMAGHESQIPRAGDYLLFELAGESIILVRDARGAVHAHYNVCSRPRAMRARSPAAITGGPTHTTGTCSRPRACPRTSVPRATG
jgi:hypothetical protein